MDAADNAVQEIEVKGSIGWTIKLDISSDRIPTPLFVRPLWYCGTGVTFRKRGSPSFAHRPLRAITLAHVSAWYSCAVSAADVSRRGLGHSLSLPRPPTPTTPSQTPAKSTTDAVIGPTTQTIVPATPAPLTLEHQYIIVLTLRNIVSTANPDYLLDSQIIALRARNAEYNPKRFAAVIMRIRDPEMTALIYASGKMVITGANSEDASRLASRKYARIIQRLGFDAKFSEFKIQNIVGSCGVKFPIRSSASIRWQSHPGCPFHSYPRPSHPTPQHHRTLPHQQLPQAVTIETRFS